MLVPAELFRAAGNVLLSPIRLASSPQLAACHRALLVGAADPETVAAVTAELRAVAPDVEVEVSGGGSSTGFAALIEGTVEIAYSSRPIGEEIY